MNPTTTTSPLSLLETHFGYSAFRPYLTYSFFCLHKEKRKLIARLTDWAYKATRKRTGRNPEYV